MRLVKFFTQHPSAWREVEQTTQIDLGPFEKPKGLWISDEAEEGWHEWCSAEMPDWAKRWTHYVEYELAPEANILRLRTAQEIDAFTEKYSTNETLGAEVVFLARYFRNIIDWKKVAAEYDGIIITPYQWARRMNSETQWYYGWDCASGCVWRPANALITKSIRRFRKRKGLKRLAV